MRSMCVEYLKHMISKSRAYIDDDVILHHNQGGNSNVLMRI